MENSDKICQDCRFYIPIDVFKGMCMHDKKSINADDAACERFQKVEKCKYCLSYIPESDTIGRCGQHLAYPEMNATTCLSFAWISKN